jgi:hypothetical protein
MEMCVSRTACCGCITGTVKESIQFSVAFADRSRFLTITYHINKPKQQRRYSAVDESADDAKVEQR